MQLCGWPVPVSVSACVSAWLQVSVSILHVFRTLENFATSYLQCWGIKFNVRWKSICVEYVTEWVFLAELRTHFICNTNIYTSSVPAKIKAGHTHMCSTVLRIFAKHFCSICQNGFGWNLGLSYNWPQIFDRARV